MKYLPNGLWLHRGLKHVSSHLSLECRYGNCQKNCYAIYLVELSIYTGVMNTKTKEEKIKEVTGLGISVDSIIPLQKDSHDSFLQQK